MNNSIWTTILHAVASVILFAIPVLLSIHGTWQDMTVGGILNAIYLHFVVKK